MKHRKFALLTIIILTFCSCNQHSNSPTPTNQPQKVIVISPPAPTKEIKSKQDLTRQKLSEVQLLKASLSDRATELRQKIQKFTDDIQTNVNEIMAKKSETSQTVLEKTIANKDIQFCLETISVADAYIQIVTEALSQTELGRSELNGLEKRLKLDIELLDSMDVDSVDDLIAKLNIVITEYQPQAEMLKLPRPQDAKTKSLDEIYQKYIRTEEEKRQQEQKKSQEQKQQDEARKAEYKKQVLQQLKAKFTTKDPDFDFLCLQPLYTFELNKPFPESNAKEFLSEFKVIWSGKPSLFAFFSPIRIFIYDAAEKKAYSPFSRLTPRAESYKDVMWSPDNTGLAILTEHKDDDCESSLKVWSFTQREATFREILKGVNVQQSERDCWWDPNCCFKAQHIINWTNDTIVIHRFGASGGKFFNDFPIHIIDVSESHEYAFRRKAYLTNVDQTVATGNGTIIYHVGANNFYEYNLATRKEVGFDECPWKSDPKNLFKQCQDLLHISQIMYDNGTLVVLSESKNDDFSKTTYRISFWNWSDKTQTSFTTDAPVVNIIDIWWMLYNSGRITSRPSKNYFVVLEQPPYKKTTPVKSSGLQLEPTPTYICKTYRLFKDHLQPKQFLAVLKAPFDFFPDGFIKDDAVNFHWDPTNRYLIGINRELKVAVWDTSLLD
ncbi:TPA: hypothetical protein DF272_06320 [Candidatus Falkowbacteria bacterium]|nr:hypothetical protein [Candidatus Falkowbacteria bacterium]